MTKCNDVQTLNAQIFFFFLHKLFFYMFVSHIKFNSLKLLIIDEYLNKSYILNYTLIFTYFKERKITSTKFTYPGQKINIEVFPKISACQKTTSNINTYIILLNKISCSLILRRVRIMFIKMSLTFPNLTFQA